MAENETGTRNWGAITGIVVLIAIAVGLLYYYYVGLWIPAIGIPLLIIGAYEAISSILRSTAVDQFGTSDSGAATVWGFVFIAIGGALMVFQYSNNIIFPIVFFIAIIVLYLVVSAANKKRK
jgi:hypothetical protein